MSRNRGSNGGGAAFAALLFVALLWWLRWVILAGAVITLAVLVTRRLIRGYAAGSRVRGCGWADSLP